MNVLHTTSLLHTILGPDVSSHVKVVLFYNYFILHQTKKKVLDRLTNVLVKIIKLKIDDVPRIEF